MKKNLLPHLVCIGCHKALSLDAFERSGEDVTEGLLSCACGRSFPIHLGVPRFTPLDDPEWFSRWKARTPSTSQFLSAQEAIQPEETVSSFGFEWHHFHRPYSRRKIEAVVLGQTRWEADAFKGKLVLDAGCGGGYQSRFMAEQGAEVIGVDLSDSVEVAHQHLKEFPTAHVVQADLHQLPFRKSYFDLVYSEGVLHHTPNPFESFSGILSYVKNGGQIAAGFYLRQKGLTPDYVVRETIRLICRYLPKKMTYYLTWLSIPMTQMFLLKHLFRNRLFLWDETNPDPHYTWCLNYDWYGKHRYQFYFTREQIRDFVHRPEHQLKSIVEGKPNFYRATVSRSSVE